mmetsp:Transcript_16151/g.38359  ORF Transcript_16151/g.38359 Transcript_16151/m.38359 type:complete len:506 (+) Transcript_16151:2375-3892(+)
MVAQPLHQPLPHHGILVVEVGQAVELAMLQEVRAALVVRVVDQAAIVRVVMLRLVEGLQDRHVPGIAGIHLLAACVVHVHIHNDLHLPLVQQNHQLPHIFLRAIGRVDLVQVLGPVAVVAVRHLVHHRGQDQAIHAQLLQVVDLLHEPRQIPAAILVQLLAVLGVRSGEAVDEHLVHGHLWPGPRSHGQVVPLLLRGVLRCIPHAARQRAQPRSFLDVRLVFVLDVGLVEELLVALDGHSAAVLAAPSALVTAVARFFICMAHTAVHLHMEELPHQDGVPLLVAVAAAWKAHLHVRWLPRPRAGVQHVVACGLPAGVVQHAATHAGVPLLVQELQLHLELFVLAVLGQERLLRHGEVMLLVCQNLQDVSQALRRRSDHHDTCIHEPRVAIAHCADRSAAFRENFPGTFCVDIEHHVCVHQRHLRVLRHSPNCELVHDAAPPLVNYGVRIHHRRHGDGVRVINLDPIPHQDLQMLLWSLVDHVLGHDRQDVLVCPSCSHRLHKNSH